MEVDLVTEEMWEGENCILDDSNEDILNFDGERCGICMDVVIDRGVLDCCQHWFCFACIDNWATITSLCPLCQNEFQLITCVPVYDTVGGCKTDEDRMKSKQKNQRSEESRESLFGCDKDMNNTLSSSISNNLNSKETLSDGNGVYLNFGQQQMELTLFEDGSYSPSLSLSPVKLRINTGDANKIALRHLNNRLPDLGLDYNPGSSAPSVMTDLKVNNKAEDNVPGDVEPGKNFEEYLLPDDKMVSDKMEILSVNSTTPDEKETIIKVTGAKRKRRDRRLLSIQLCINVDAPRFAVGLRKCSNA